jgi:cellulose synthase/poly-beta-1,6-N-acetylglucosamine synthase-like glycosyltransferase
MEFCYICATHRPTSMKISVVIAYYDNLSKLELVLDALNCQTYNNFEVIIAEDDNNPDTRSFLEANRDAYAFPIIHLDQEEKRGFRKTAMLNKAVRASRGETLVFMDGDCIPHRHFLKEYGKRSKSGIFLYGRRVLLGKKISEAILESRSLSYLRLLSILFSDSRLKKEAIYWPYFSLHRRERRLSGHNWGIRKQELLKVNGFDEDYDRPGVGEDYDIEWRLKSAGLKMRSMKNRAIVYHLDHPKLYAEENARHNYSLLEQKKLTNRVRCLNGLETI